MSSTGRAVHDVSPGLLDRLRRPSVAPTAWSREGRLEGLRPRRWHAGGLPRCRERCTGRFHREGCPVGSCALCGALPVGRSGTTADPARPGERCFPRAFIVNPEGAEGTGMNPSPAGRRRYKVVPESAGVCPPPGVPSLMFFQRHALPNPVASRKTSRGATSGTRLPVRLSK